MMRSTVALCIWLSTFNLMASLPYYTKWEVRLTGSNNNGGAFDPGSRSGGFNGSGCTGGTDYSQQDAAQVAFNGTSITATTAGTSPTITITGYTVATTDKCNGLQILSGTNFTAGFYVIASVNVGANTWTLDRNVSSGIGAAMVGNMGGAIADLNQLFAAIQSGGFTSNGMYAYVKAGTYTRTTAITVCPANIVVANFTVEGYQTTRGDLGTRPLITTGTTSIKLLNWLEPCTAGVKFLNVSFSNTAGTRDAGFFAQTNTGFGGNVQCDLCKFDGFTYALRGAGVVNFAWNSISLRRTEVTNSTIAGVLTASNLYVEGCNFHDNPAPAIQMIAGLGFRTSGVIERSVFSANGTGVVTATTASAVRLEAADPAQNFVVRNNYFYANIGDGLHLDSSSQGNGFWVSGNVFEANTSYGIKVLDVNGLAAWLFSTSNATFNNTLGAYFGWPTDATDITLTSSPAVNAAGGNFALNSTVGGGAALKGVDFPGTIPGAGTGYLDVGPLQTQGAASGGNSSCVASLFQREDRKKCD